jgi:hypothetical protein
MALRALAEAITARSISSLGPSQPALVNSGFFMPKFPTGQTFLAIMWIFKLSPNRFQPQFDNGCAEA